MVAARIGEITVGHKSADWHAGSVAGTIGFSENARDIISPCHPRLGSRIHHKKTLSSRGLRQQHATVPKAAASFSRQRVAAVPGDGGIAEQYPGGCVHGERPHAAIAQREVRHIREVATELTADER